MSVYGRANAPWCWLQEVIRRRRRLGFTPHSLDLLGFLRNDAHTALDAVIVFHVDDTLST